jgi:hypothetical protein
MRVYVICCVFAGLLISSSAEARKFMGTTSRAAGPDLLGPCTDNAKLNGKIALQFHWWPSRFGSVYYTDFKLYRGYDTTDQNLILKERIRGGSAQVSVPKEKFQAGETYTWMINEVTLAGRKSDRSFCSFTLNPESEARKE